MGVRILYDDDNEQAAIYCSTTEWSFGPVFHDEGDHDARDRAELFLEWMNDTGKKDPRKYTDSELESIYSEFRRVEDKLWKKLAESEEADENR